MNTTDQTTAAMLKRLHQEGKISMFEYIVRTAK